jgi:hypothetical protein
VPDEPDLPASAEEQRELLAGLRAVVEAKDAENAMLRAELAAERELRRRLGPADRGAGTPAGHGQHRLRHWRGYRQP